MCLVLPITNKNKKRLLILNSANKILREATEIDAIGHHFDAVLCTEQFFFKFK